MAQDMEIAELALACAEVLEWHRTGIYSGSVLEKLAAERFSEFGDDAMRQAEDLVLRQAAQFVIDAAPANHLTH